MTVSPSSGMLFSHHVGLYFLYSSLRHGYSGSELSACGRLSHPFRLWQLIWGHLPAPSPGFSVFTLPYLCSNIFYWVAFLYKSDPQPSAGIHILPLLRRPLSSCLDSVSLSWSFTGWTSSSFCLCTISLHWTSLPHWHSTYCIRLQSIMLGRVGTGSLLHTVRLLKALPGGTWAHDALFVQLRLWCCTRQFKYISQKCVIWYYTKNQLLLLYIIIH